MFLFQVSTGQDFKTIMYDLRQEDGFAVFTFFGTFYTLAIFVFLNLFVAVLLEAFENEFDSSMELDLTSEDIILFKDLWDDKLDLLVCGTSCIHTALVPFARCLHGSGAELSG